MQPIAHRNEVDLPSRPEPGKGNRFRVFYRVESEERRVRILAIAVKERNRLFLAGEKLSHEDCFCGRLKARLSSCLKASASGPVVVARNGKAVAVLVGFEDASMWSACSWLVHRNFAPSLMQQTAELMKEAELLTMSFGKRSRQPTALAKRTAAARSAKPNVRN